MPVTRLRRPWIGLFCLVVQLTPVDAAVYRCVGEKGEPSFSQLPCITDAATPGDPIRAAPVPAYPAAPEAAGVRASERAWLRGRERERQSRTKPKRAAAARGSKKGDRDRQAYRCLRKRRALDAVNAELRGGYRAGRGAALHRRQQGYRDYLSAFCD